MSKSVSYPDPVDTALEAVRHAGGGDLRPEDVVTAAQAVLSPLHRFFEWDDRIASHQYRLEQARRLIRARVTYVPAPEPRRVRAYVHLADDGNRRYKPLGEVVRNDEFRREYHRRLINELAGCVRRLRAFDSVTGVPHCIETLQALLDDLKRPPPSSQPPGPPSPPTPPAPPPLSPPRWPRRR